tara:strand:+ start:67 stop:1170 length:1104 start_codon:yes stop_codon:yes gene_type:complete
MSEHVHWETTLKTFAYFHKPYHVRNKNMPSKQNLNVVDFESTNDPQSVNTNDFYDESLVSMVDLLEEIESASGVIPFSKEIEGTEGEYKTLPVKNLKLDKNYQRLICEKTIRKAKRLNLQALVPVIVFQRPDGNYAVVDGQHRCMMALKGGGPEFQVPCIVHLHPTNYTLSECKDAESNFFKMLNFARKNLSGLDKYRVGIAQGDENSIAFENNLITLGVYAENLGDTDSGIQVENWSKLEESWRKYGIEKTSLAVRFMRKIAETHWQKNHIQGGLTLGLTGIYHLTDFLDSKKVEGINFYLKEFFPKQTCSHLTKGTPGRTQDILLVRRIVGKYNDLVDAGVITKGSKIGETVLSNAGFSDPSKIS